MILIEEKNYKLTSIIERKDILQGNRIPIKNIKKLAYAIGSTG
jgi:hypothetical protein